MKQELEQAVADVVQAAYKMGGSVELTRPDEQFGDFSTNIALQLAGQLGQKPRDIADALTGGLRSRLADTVSEVTVAGAGFINLRLNDAALQAAAVAAPAKSLQGQTVLTEYSDPNPFKPLHAGHLYTTLVGDTISRLIENAGAKVVRINYGGDVGLHVGKCMWAIVQHLGGEFPDKLNDISEADRPAWLGERYVEGNTAYEDDPSAKAEIVEMNRRVYQLHADDDHDSPFAVFYWTCRTWSYDYFAELYQQLQVRPFNRYIPESEVTPLGLQTVREQLERGVYEYGDMLSTDDPASDGKPVAESSSAARPVIYKPDEASGLHTRVFINSAGLPTYEAKDVGLLLTKWRDYQFDRSIYITANEQAQYMAVMFASVARFLPEPVSRSLHLTHGVVKLEGGVKMSSRKGNAVTALDILEAARTAAGQVETAAGRSGQPADATILAAVKYAFAKNRIGGDIAYSPAESIALEGNSGPYLQYALVRACSILAKAPTESTTEGPAAQTLEPAERSLLRKLSEYAETVDRATTELMPHHICGYLYELAQTFNRFYEHNRVIGDDRQGLRLQLVRQYADTLQAGLGLLGITAPDRM